MPRSPRNDHALLRRPPALLLALITVLATAFVVGCGNEADPSALSSGLNAPKTSLAGAATVEVRIDFGDAVALGREDPRGITVELSDRAGRPRGELHYDRARQWIELGIGNLYEMEGDAPGRIEVDGAAVALYLYHRNVQEAEARKSGKAGGQISGCDLFPDLLESQCIKDCCETHDQCYEQNDCNMLSWIGLGSPACQMCNLQVSLCIAGCTIVHIVDAVGWVIDWIIPG